MTDTNPTTRRALLAVLPAAGAAAVLPAGAERIIADQEQFSGPDAALPDSPMDRMTRLAREIRDILVSQPFDGKWKVTIDPISNSFTIDAVPRARRTGRSNQDDADASLLRLGVEFERLWAIERRIADREGDVDAEFEAARDKTEVVVRQIAKIEPATLAGLRMLARVCEWIESDHYDPKGLEDYENRLRQQVINGVTRLV